MTGPGIREVGDADAPVGVFPPLQPDILGEFFVLDFLTGKESRSRWLPRLRKVLDTAWRLAPFGTTIFLDRLQNDFINHAHIADFMSAPDNLEGPDKLPWAMIRVNFGYVLNENERHDEALTACDDLINRFKDDPAPEIQKIVASAMLNKAIALGTSKGPDQEIAAYDTLINRFKDDPAPEIRELVARPCSTSEHPPLKQRPDEAITAYDDLVNRFKDAPAPEIRKQVAKACSTRQPPRQSKRPDEAITACDDLINRFKDDPTPEIQERIAKAMLNKAVALGAKEPVKK